MTGSPDVVVAGGGALGLTAAFRLAQAGARVRLFEPNPTGRNASGVAAGMLAPVFEGLLDPAARPHLVLLRSARDLWPSLADDAGIMLDRSGATAVGDEGWLAELAERAGSLGADLQVSPGLPPNFRQGLRTAEDWRIDAVAALAALEAAARASGVEIVRDRLGAEARAGVTVIATGADRGLAGRAPELDRLSPIKGHILRAAGRLDGVVRGQGVYLAPAADGIIVGATMEPGRADLDVDPEQVARLRAAGARLLPDLAEAPLTVQTGVRAATPDGLPLVGWSRTPGVLLAAGARRNGWLLAPLVAELVRDLALGRDAGPQAWALRPGRFEGEGR